MLSFLRCVTVTCVLIAASSARAAAAASVPTGPGQAAPQDGDVVARARTLAVAGQRAEAIRLLEARVAARPDDSDARVLLGTVLSWESRYDDARRALDYVLQQNRAHGDAIVAKINVELWSGHTAEAERLSADAVRGAPNRSDVMLARARVLKALGRDADARNAVDRVLQTEPRNEDAQQMRRQFPEKLLPWRLGSTYTYDRFSDRRRTPWEEAAIELKRHTPVGPIIARASHARRFSLEDELFEIEMYPRLRPGTYAYVAGGYAPDPILYPEYRAAVDLYQALGKGFEGSVGYRRLGFGRGVDIYTPALTKYYGNYLFTVRAYLTPSTFATSRSYHVTTRRYFGDGTEYISLRYSQGSFKEELRDRSALDVLDSNAAYAELVKRIGRRVDLTLGGGASREDRVERRDLRQYSASAGLYFRF